MKVKIDTKERLHVITIHGPDLAANMTEMDRTLMALLDGNVKNVVVDLEDIQTLNYAAATELLKLQDRFYQRQASFVVCNLPFDVKRFLTDHDLLGQLNVAPTAAEAMDIVQMEEIERELGL